MKVAVVGKGKVGKALAPAIKKAGYDTAYAVRDPADPKYAGGDDVALMSMAAAGDWADVIILAVHWGVIDSALAELGTIGGKTLVDCTNPLDFANKLAWLIPADTSGAAIIAGKTDAHVVKAFNQVGAAVMAGASLRSPGPVQFAASDYPDAKAAVIELMRAIGFDARDGGGLDYARELEGMARIWIAQAFGGMSPTMGWALIDG